MISNLKTSTMQKLLCVAWLGALTLVSLSAEAMLLVCRGGGQMALDVDSQDSGEAWITTHYQAYTGPNANVRLDGSHLAAGECSTTFRALRSQEVLPMRHLVQQNALVFMLSVRGQDVTSTYPDSNSPAGFYRNWANDGDQNLSYLQSSVIGGPNGIFDSSRVFYFDLTPSFDTQDPNWYVSYVNDHYVRRVPRYRLF